MKKTERENYGLTKNINDMRAVINTSAPSLGEKGNKTIGDLNRQRVLIEEENIKLFNEKKYFKEDSSKTFQNSKDLKAVF